MTDEIICLVCGEKLSFLTKNSINHDGLDHSLDMDDFGNYYYSITIGNNIIHIQNSPWENDYQVMITDLQSVGEIVSVNDSNKHLSIPQWIDYVKNLSIL